MSHIAFRFRSSASVQENVSKPIYTFCKRLESKVCEAVILRLSDISGYMSMNEGTKRKIISRRGQSFPFRVPCSPSDLNSQSSCWVAFSLKGLCKFMAGHISSYQPSWSCPPGRERLLLIAQHLYIYISYFCPCPSQNLVSISQRQHMSVLQNGYI